MPTLDEQISIVCYRVRWLENTISSSRIWLNEHAAVGYAIELEHAKAILASLERLWEIEKQQEEVRDAK